MTQTIAAEQKLQLIREAIDESKAESVEVLDLKNLTLVADYFVVATGTSNVHIRAIVDNAVKKLREQKIHVNHVEGQSQAKWVLVDFGDVILHVFAAEEREFYDLETLWSATANKLGVG